MANNEVSVPLLDLKPQYAAIKADIDAAIKQVVDSQYFIMGPVVAEFEKEIAAYCRSKRAIGCASGSDALLIPLMALNIQPGDEVICPSYTFFATAGTIWRLGAKPVFADIDPATYNMDVESVRDVAAKCRRLKAIMPVHLYGQCVDMDAYLDLGRDFGVPIIEDAAQAIGAEDTTGARAGTKGLVGCFSFFPSKNLGAFGDGGICTTNDDAIAHRMGILRNHGMEPKYYHECVGLNSRLDALQAAILRVKLRHLDTWTKGRQQNAAFYDKTFKDAGALTSATPLYETSNSGALPLRTPEPAPKRSRHIYNQYVIRVPAAIRDELRTHLTERKVATEIYYPVPLHMQQCFVDLGYHEGDLPHSEQAAKETIALPIYPELTAEQKAHVANTIIAFVSKRAPAVSTRR